MKSRTGIVIVGRMLLLATVLITTASSEGAPGNINNPTATTQQQKSSRLWNLKDTDIRTFVHSIAEETDKNFVIDPRVTGKITFISSQPLTKDELYQAFLSALQVNGFVAIPSGSVVKVVPDYVAKGLSSPIYTDTMRKEGDAMAVSVVGIRYVPVNELAAALNQFLTPSGHLAAYAPANDLIVADRAGNIMHLMRLIQQIDQQRSSKIELVHLHNAQAKTLVDTLKSILGQKASAAAGQSAIDLSLAADERTNSLLISGGSPEQRLQIRAVIASLDIANTQPSYLTEVIYLKHLHAEPTAKIVNGMIQNYVEKNKPDNQASAQAAQSANSADSAGNSATDNNAQNLFNNTMSANNQSNSQGSSYGAQGGYTSPNANSNDISTITRKNPKSGSVSSAVQWEESTNSLIVTAPRDILRKIKLIIGRIDIRRPQVLIEAVIAEVAVDRAREMGIELNPGNKVQFLTRFTPLAALSTIGTDGQLAANGTADTAGQGLSLTANGNQIRVLIRALESDSASNVLATPNLVTLDNEAAQIKVGQQISFATSQIVNNPTGGNPLSFYDRQDVGLVLTLIPQITPNGAIKLLVQQELSTLIPNSAHAGGNPDTTERFIRTTVMADDGQILVLGGLLQNQWGETESKVPLLGDIPGIGLLVKSKSKTSTKTNLMIFLKPTIMYNDSDDERVSGGKYEFLRQSQLQTERDSPSKYSYESPALPVHGKDVSLPQPFPMLEARQGQNTAKWKGQG